MLFSCPPLSRRNNFNRVSTLYAVGTTLRTRFAQNARIGDAWITRRVIACMPSGS
jgi:hypothetical protein